MTLSQIEVFIKVIQLKSFTRAGEELGMTQSSVSHSISKLEEYFGTKLIDRNKKAFQLTSIGEKMYENMKSIMKTVSVMNSQITEIKKLPKKTLMLGGYQGSTLSFFPKILRGFKAVFPEIDVILLEGSHEEIEEWLEDEVIDLALIGYPNAKYYTEYLFQDELKIVLSKKHPLRNSEMIKSKDLKGEDFIISREYPKEEIIKFYNYHNLNIDIKYRVTNLTTILKMVKENIGITMMPTLFFYNKDSYPFQDELIVKPLATPIYLKTCFASKYEISNDIVNHTFIEKVKQIIDIHILSEKE